MTILDGTFTPYEFDTKEGAYSYVCERALFIKKSITLIEADNEHLCLRMPCTADQMDVLGTPQELAWLNKILCLNRWYRIK